MINSMKTKIAIGLLASFSTTAIFALTVSNTTSVSQGFVFIENNIDKEYMIISNSLDPRFTGSNVWTRLSSNQTSLGYMGTNRPLSPTSNAYVDVWLENSPIKNPYQGLRCLQGGAGAVCPAEGYFKGELIDEKGSYKSKTKNATEYGGYYRRGSFAAGAYDYFNNLSTGSVATIDMNTCSTREEYDPNNGGRCKNASSGVWEVLNMTVSKIAHIRLIDTKAFNEIWIAPDGTPSLSENNEFCDYTVISGGGTADQTQGIACKMIKYHIDGTPSQFPGSLRLSMIVDTAALGGLNLMLRDLQISGGNGVWAPYSSLNQMSDLMVSGDGYVSVFFSKAFFKKMIEKGGTTHGKNNIFTFAINNTLAPQSGFYQFSTSMRVDVIPREYSISIRPQNPNITHLQGKIGANEPSIDFDYTVTQSAPRKADLLTAQVIGDTVKVSGHDYCLFKSDDAQINVAIPSYLSYINSNGIAVENYSGCNKKKIMNLTNAFWFETPWDEAKSGFFYRTDLKLRFPMNDPVSLFSLDGADWLGIVHAEGEVKVDAKWISP